MSWIPIAQRPIESALFAHILAGATAPLMEYNNGVAALDIEATARSIEVHEPPLTGAGEESASLPKHLLMGCKLCPVMINELKKGRRRGMKPGAALLAVAALAALTPMHARAETLPSPPCNAELPQPPYASLGAAPNVQVWHQGSLPEFSARAACVGWPAPNFELLIALAGTFAARDAADLLSRFGAISTTLGMRYWSTTDHLWRPLVTAASAFTKPVDGQPREDFTSAELATGLDEYISQSDNRGAGQVIYRMRVRESKVNRLVIETENLTPIRWLAFTLLKPGSLGCVYILDRRSPGIWSYYSLTRIAERNWFISGHENSYVNRVVAQYRHIAGIPTDLDPPFAP